MLRMRSGFKKMTIYGYGLFSIKLISLIMLPLITHILTPSEYGTLEVIQISGNLVSILFGFGVSEALFRFAGTAESSEIEKQIIDNGMLLNFVVALIFFIIIIMAAYPLTVLLPGNVTLWQIYFWDVGLFFNSLWTFQLACLRIKQDALGYVLISFSFSFLFACFIAIALFAGYKVTGIMFASLCANMLICIYVLFYKATHKIAYNREWQIKLLKYGLPLIGSGVGEFLILWLGNFWLAYVLLMSEFAQYALAMKFAIMVSFIMTPFYTWWFPIRFKNLHTDEGRSTCAQMTESAVVMGFVFCFLISLASILFIKLFIPNEYNKAIEYIPWVCLFFALKNAGEFMNTGILLNKTVYVMWINNTAAFFNIIGLFFLVPLFHAWGAIITLNCVYLLRWIAFTYFGHDQIELSYRYQDLAFFTIILVGFLFGLSFINNVFDYIIKGGLLALIMIILAYMRDFIPRIFTKVE